MKRIIWRTMGTVSLAYLVLGTMGCPSTSNGTNGGCGSNQTTDPSTYCDVGTVWNANTQKCVRSN